MSELIETKAPVKPGVFYALTSIIFGVVGWIASLALTVERIRVAENPDATLACDVSPFISCKSVMLTEQASLFGFPNPLIGLASFFAPVLIGFAVLAGAEFKNWFWNAYLVGNILGFVFVLWLFSQSVFVIDALCPYCMVAWVAMIPLLWMNAGLVMAKGALGEKLIGTGEVIYEWNWVATIATYVAISLVILVVYWDLWPTLF